MDVLLQGQVQGKPLMVKGQRERCARAKHTQRTKRVKSELKDNNVLAFSLSPSSPAKLHWFLLFLPLEVFSGEEKNLASLCDLTGH